MIAISARSRRAVFVSVVAACLALPAAAGPRNPKTATRSSKPARPSARVADPAPIIVIPPGSAYRQMNLVSDVPGVALVTDPLLVNPWGVALTATSPFWVSNNGSSTSTLYRGDVGGSPLTINPGLSSITIPGNQPTGAVANGTSDFVVTVGAASGPALFLFASETGNITGWNPNVPAAGSTTAVNAASQPGHVYTGLALANNGSGNFLYAADFANGTIDVFNNVFALQPAASFPFVDPTIPTTVGNTYHPFNVQNIGGSLYVTYAKVGTGGEAEDGVGNGFVRRFNTNGVRDLTFGINNGPLNAPWGITIAPASFGIFGGALLVGNFGEGNPSIHAFNPTTGAFLGTLQDESGNGIVIDELWGLIFGNGVNGGDPGTLYFTAGIGEEEHGLFGSLKPTTASAVALVRFSSTDYAVNETSGSISVTVVREGDTTGTASVNYAALIESGAGKASAADFTLPPGTVTFASGETSKSFLVAITNDALVEGDETLTLFLSNPAGAGLATPNVATLTIADDGGAPPSGLPLIPPGSAYRQMNLVSDVPGVALVTDPLLVNPWGVALTATSPFWVSNNGSSTSTLYRGDVGGSPLTINPGLSSITIPGNQPTGAVANGTSDFVVTVGAASGPALFLFASETGNITGWNPNVPAAGSTTAVNAASQPGHVYTGLALANNGSGNFLYAADFANGTIDVFNNVFALQPAASFPFVDPTIPTTVGNTYHPFNVQNIGGSLYVTYAKVGTGGEAEDGVGNGFVRRFNTNGVRDLTFGINNGPLNAPWGITIAPASFGIFGGALLVGNFGEGNPSIHAFNPTTGAFLGTLQDESGNGIVIDELWGLIFGNGVNGGDPGTLYFTAGIGEEEHGLFGSLKPTTASAVALVRFSSTDYAVNETSGSISVTVVREGDTTGTASVNYAALIESGAGKASAADFTLPPGTVTFASGETSKSFLVAITNDALVEGDETLTLFLSNPAGAGLATPNVATLAILDNGTGVANVSITKTGPVSVLPGATFTYTLTAANAGPDAAVNVTVTDVLPAAVTFVSATPSQGSCSGTTTVTCTLGTIASGASATIALVVTAPTAPTAFSNTATVTSAQTDPDSANNTATAPVVAGTVTIPTLSVWALLAFAAALTAVGIGTLLRR